MPSCYLCGKPATKPLALKDSFTAHSLARCPESKHLCDRCDYALNLRCLYYNPSKEKWVPLYARNWSWLYQGRTLLAPTIAAERTEGKYTMPTVSNLPTRAQMRGWLLEPPKPPFTIAIAESGQKHILPWAQEGHDRDYFPVQFEIDSLWIDRAQFAELLSHYEALMAIGFSKTEIDSGNWHSDRLMTAIHHGWDWQTHESAIAPHRGSRLLQLCSHVAQKPATTPETTPAEAPEPATASILPTGQLSLF